MKRKKEETPKQILLAAKKQEKVDNITHKLAIAFVFVAVFYFFIKLVFL
ncbi:MAG: hypothetical protein JWQ38_2912 [Flavipsychrobacter sp.]|nr:hypothetical protein [Flavipsychrobacter sp.]